MLSPQLRELLEKAWFAIYADWPSIHDTTSPATGGPAWLVQGWQVFSWAASERRWLIEFRMSREELEDPTIPVDVRNLHGTRTSRDTSIQAVQALIENELLRNVRSVVRRSIRKVGYAEPAESRRVPHTVVLGR